jgi:hypothetical protein
MQRPEGAAGQDQQPQMPLVPLHHTFAQTAIAEMAYDRDLSAAAMTLYNRVGWISQPMS